MKDLQFARLSLHILVLKIGLHYSMPLRIQIYFKNLVYATSEPHHRYIETDIVKKRLEKKHDFEVLITKATIVTYGQFAQT